MKNFLYFLTFVCAIIADQITKKIFTNQPGEFRNYAFAFSLPIPTWLIYIIYAILLAALIFWFWRKQHKNWQARTGFALILAGALSNIGERIALGYVRDFIHIHTGVFNVADFIIIFGILLLLFEDRVQKLED